MSESTDIIELLTPTNLSAVPALLRLIDVYKGVKQHGCMK